MVKKITLLLFFIIYCNTVLCMEDMPLPASGPETAVSLSAKLIFNKYLNTVYNIIYPKDNEIYSDTYFFKCVNNPQSKLFFVAKKIIVIDEDTFNKKNSKNEIKSNIIIDDLLTNFNKKNNENNISQVYLDKGCIVLILSKIFYDQQNEFSALNNEFSALNNIMLAAPAIEFTHSIFWKWAKLPKTQSDNIFGSFGGPTKITLAYKTDVTIDYLTKMHLQSLQDSFIFVDKDHGNNWYKELFTDNPIGRLKELFTDNPIGRLAEFLKHNFNINTITNILRSCLQENDSIEYIKLLVDTMVNNINSIALSELTNIDTTLLQNLCAKYTEQGVQIVNMVLSKIPSKETEIMSNLGKDLIQKGYMFVNNQFIKTEAPEPQQKETIEIRYVLFNTTGYESVNTPKQSATKDESASKLYFVDMTKLPIQPSVIMASRVTLYTSDKEAVFNSMTDQGTIIEIPGEINKSYLFDFRHLPKAHVVGLFQENYLDTEGKHKIQADHVVVASGSVFNALSKNPENKKNFSPLQENTIGLIYYSLLKNVNNISEKETVFDGYPKEDVKFTINNSMPINLFPSYRGTENSDILNFKEGLEKPSSIIIESEKPSEEPSKEPSLDDLILKIADEWIQSFNKRLKSSSDKAYDDMSNRFDFTQCELVYQTGQELNEKLNIISGEGNYQKKLPLLKLFSSKYLTDKSIQNKSTALMTQDGDVFIVPSKIFEDVIKLNSLQFAVDSMVYSVNCTSAEFKEKYNRRKEKLESLQNAVPSVKPDARQEPFSVADPFIVPLPTDQPDKDSDNSTLKNTQEKLLLQVKKIVEKGLYDNKKKQFKTEQCNKLIGASRNLTILANDFNKYFTTKKPIKDVFFNDILNDNIKKNQELVFLTTSDDWMFITPKEALEYFEGYKKAELEHIFYSFTFNKEQLQNKLQDIYSNKKKQSSEKPLPPVPEKQKGANNSVPGLPVPVKPEKPQSTWSWYKPWTWSWGGYYFKKESYHRDYPEKAQQYEEKAQQYEADF